MTRKLLFVFNSFLGWRTYARQVERVVDQRDDVSAQTLLLPSTIWHRTVVKRHSRNWTDPFTRHVDPISAYEWWLGRRVRAEVEAYRPDVIHFGPHLPAAATATTHPSIPFTVTLDCTRFNMNEYLGRPVWGLRELARETGLLRRASRLYAMSDWAEASLVRDCGIPEDRIRVMPPSIDLRAFGSPNPSKGLPRILFIGNDFQRKGGDRLHRWVTGPLAGTCELHIVSEDPAARVQGDRIVHHGRVEHARLMGELMPAMDIFCLPTRSDMSPHVLVEAAAAGLPSVASGLGGIPDLIIEGRTGFAVPPKDDEAFLAKLRELIASPDRRHNMGAAAAKHARAHFDASRNYNDLIDDLIELAG